MHHTCGTHRGAIGASAAAAFPSRSAATVVAAATAATGLSSAAVTANSKDTVGCTTSRLGCPAAKKSTGQTSDPGQATTMSTSITR